MSKTNQLLVALQDMQDQTIGLFHPRFYPQGQYICVIENDNGVLKCLEVGQLLGISTTQVSSTVGNYIPFPDGKTLTQMMEDVVFFHNWYKENAK